MFEFKYKSSRSCAQFVKKHHINYIPHLLALKLVLFKEPRKSELSETFLAARNSPSGEIMSKNKPKMFLQFKCNGKKQTVETKSPLSIFVFMSRRIKTKNLNEGFDSHTPPRVIFVSALNTPLGAPTQRPVF